MACQGSSPNWIAPTWSDVADCHTQAASGDTITVAPGSYAVATQTSITKYVKILAGGVVNLTDNVCGGQCFNGNNDNMILLTGNNVGSVQFGAIGSGFNIVQGTSIHGAPSGVIKTVSGGSNFPPLVLGNTYTGSGVFLKGFGKNGVYAGNTGHTQPVTANCFNVDFFVHLESDGSEWTQVSKFGNLDTGGDYKFYIEKNTVNFFQEGVSLNGGARAVIRFNTFTNSGIDHHGANTQTFGGRYEEVYGNTFNWDGRTNWPNCSGTTQNIGPWWTGGGGTALVIGNNMDNIPTTDWGVKFETRMLEERIWRAPGAVWSCWGTPSQPSGFTGTPIPFQPGWGYVSGGTQAGNATLFGNPVMMDREPTYLANNVGGADFDTPSIQNYTQNECSSAQTATDYVRSDLEYYKQVALGSFNGTTGASQGTRAQMNAISTCTQGVGFWVTDEGNWNQSGAGGQGRLYRCGATNNWQLYYEPFTYPHPLTGPIGGTPAPTDPRITPILLTLG